MTLLYFGVVRGALLVRRPLMGFHYSFRDSLEDLLLLTYLRGCVVLAAYTFGAGAKHHRWAFTLLSTSLRHTCTHLCVSRPKLHRLHVYFTVSRGFVMRTWCPRLHYS